MLLYGSDETVQAWGGKLASAADLERRDGRPATWALVLAPLMADIPEAAEAEPEGEPERTNGHLAPVA